MPSDTPGTRDLAVVRWVLTGSDGDGNNNIYGITPAIDSTLDQMPTTHQAKMKSLLTLNFETLEKASISPA